MERREEDPQGDGEGTPQDKSRVPTGVAISPIGVSQKALEIFRVYRISHTSECTFLEAN